ncbi:MAG: signal peptidase I [Patescibacteria group bacterium]
MDIRKNLARFRSKVLLRGTRYEWAASTISMFAIAIMTALMLNLFVFQPYEVDGSSMEPTLQHDDRLIVYKLGRTWSKIVNDEYIPDRGDIVIFDKTGSNDLQLVKRVVGLPGDTVSSVNGQILIQNQDSPEGFVFEEKFDLQLSVTEEFQQTTVRSGQVFVVGDNRLPNASLDSRSSLGSIDSDQIVGELSMRIFPLSAFKFF